MSVPRHVGPVPVNSRTIAAAVVVAILAIGGACSNRSSEEPRALSAPVTVTVTVPAFPSPTALSLPAPTPAPVTTAPTTTAPRTTAARPIPLVDPDPDVAAPREPAARPEPAAASVYYKNCAAVQAAGAAPIRRGDPGYRAALDRDGDGEGCAGD
jgi:hypothetical protein